MTDELITMLAKNSTLRIISRTSVMQYKGVHRPLREIARELGADGILEGSVERSRNAVHLTLQLIHAQTDTHMWAESYDRQTSDAVALPIEAARTIAARLGRVVSPLGTQRYISPQAHDGYIRGLYYEHTGNLPKAIETFNAVVAMQPDYALAWNELAFSYGWNSLNSRPSETTPKVKAAIRKALELDDSLAEVHTNVAGIACFYDWDWDLALKESARAVELNPNYAFGHFMRSRVLLTQNRLDESLDEMKKMQELDPRSNFTGMIDQYMMMHRFDAALEVAKTVVETQPDHSWAHIFLGYLYRRQGRLGEAAEEMAKGNFAEGGENTPAERQLARRLASRPDGYNAVLRYAERVTQEKAAHEYVPQMYLADVYGWLGDREGALRSLENAFKDRHGGIVFIQVLPWFDFLHSDERYRAIVRQMGLPPAY
jgi:tetratricopeptide (TPR) repeat protein